MTKTFEERFIELYDDGQFSAECNEARALVKEARKDTAYTKETVPGYVFVEVLNPGESRFLNKNTFGMLFWTELQKRESSVFIEFNTKDKPVEYVEYVDLKDATFLNAQETVLVEYNPLDDDEQLIPSGWV